MKDEGLRIIIMGIKSNQIHNSKIRIVYNAMYISTVLKRYCIVLVLS